MRVLEVPRKPVPARADIVAHLRSHGFAAVMAAGVATYGALLLFHPGARQVTPYPEPIGNVAYDANFPGGAGAPGWTRIIHESGLAACKGVTARHYREVGPGRCAALLGTWEADASASGTGERCRYHYASFDDARDGRRVSFVTAGAGCVLP